LPIAAITGVCVESYLITFYYICCLCPQRKKLLFTKLRDFYIEPVTLTAIGTAIGTLVATKALEKTGDKLADKILDEGRNLLSILAKKSSS